MQTPAMPTPRFPFQKSVALILTLVFSFQTAAWSAPELRFPIPASKEFVTPGIDIQIPAKWGEVKNIHQASSAESLVIHIQDAHGNYHAQKNIQKIIRHLTDQYGIKLILLEGANEKLQPTLFHFFKDHSLNLKVADILMRHGEFTGAEMALLEQSIKHQVPSTKYQEQGVKHKARGTPTPMEESNASDFSWNLEPGAWRRDKGNRLQVAERRASSPSGRNHLIPALRSKLEVSSFGVRSADHQGQAEYREQESRGPQARVLRPRGKQQVTGGK